MKLWICPVLIVLLLVGCMFVPIPPDVKNPEAVAAYNAQLFQLYMPFVTPLVTFLTFIGLWIKANLDKRELAEKTEQAAQHVAAKTEETKKEVLAKVDENTEMNRTALDVANGHNEKIIALQTKLAETPRRAPARSTDAPDHVQKVCLENGPGVDEPLKVEETHK